LNAHECCVEDVHRPILLNYFRAKKVIPDGVIKGLNHKVKVTFRKSNGFRTDKARKIALFMCLANHPNPNLPVDPFDEPKNYRHTRKNRTLDYFVFLLFFKARIGILVLPAGAFTATIRSVSTFVLAGPPRAIHWLAPFFPGIPLLISLYLRIWLTH
jgi:hypothetical protein